MKSPPPAEAVLRRAIDFIPQGLAVFDADLHLVASNARYIELQGLPDRLVTPGTPLYDIALYVARRGDMGEGEPAVLAAARVEALAGASPTVSQRIGKQGQILEVYSSRLPDGGVIVSLADVSARVLAEAALEQPRHLRLIFDDEYPHEPIIDRCG